jgi:hypothetical protein
VCSKLGVKKNQCTAATYVTWAFVRRLLWAVPQEAQSLR